MSATEWAARRKRYPVLEQKRGEQRMKTIEGMKGGG